MVDKKRLAIIGSGEMAVIITENAKRIGIETHTFSNDMHDRVVGLSDEHHCISIFDVEKIVEICTKLAVCGVIPTTELTINIAALVADRLGLNGMPKEVSSLITDKSYVRGKAKYVLDLKQPEYIVWTVGCSQPEISSFPVIVKPTSMGGKRGVSVASTQKELEKALEYAIENMPAGKDRVIIEQYIGDGKEYSVESLSYHGQHYVIQITEKITSGPPHCVELAHLQPARIDKRIRIKVEDVIKRLLCAVGVDNTTSHTEIKIVGEDVYLIELNARSGGDHIAYPLTELSTGYPYIIGAINVATDSFSPPDTAAFDSNHCGVVFIAEQTKPFKSLFDECEKYEWLYRKNVITNQLTEITNNHAFDTDYFIFMSSDQIPAEIISTLDSLKSIKNGEENCKC